MRIVVPILILIIFAGCKKEKQNDPFVLGFQRILDKYMICDSIKIKQDSSIVVNPIGKGNGEDLMFHPDATYTIYSNPTKLINFQLTPPDLLYYYQDIFDENTYYKVTTLSDSVLVLQKTDPIDNKEYTKYYRVE